MKNCPHCGNVVADSAAFCNACGKPVSAAPAEVFCPTCGEKISGGGGFCPNCGTTLNAPKKPAQKKTAPKSFNSKRSIGLIAAAAAVVALVVLIIAVVPSLFSSPSSTFVSTQADFVADRIAAVETIAEQATKGFSSDLTISAKVDNDEIQEFLDGTSIVLKVDATQESLLTAMEAVFMGSPVLSGTVTFDKDQIGFILPELDDTYYVMNLSAILELADADVDMDAMKSLEGLELPVAEVEDLLNKYIKILSGAITKDNLTVEKNQTVKYNELSGKTEKCTVYTFEPTAEEVEEVLLKIAEELENDKKLRKVFEDLFENEVIAEYLEEYAFDDDPMDVIEDALDTIVEGLEDNAADIGEAIEDVGFVWTMAVKGKDIVLIEIEMKEFEEIYAYEYKNADDKVEEIIYVSSYDDPDFFISNKYKVDGKVYDGKVTFYDGWDEYVISYEINSEKASPLGLPLGEYQFSFEGIDLDLEVVEAKQGVDHIVTIGGEDFYYETDGLFGEVEVTVNATDKSTAKKPSGTKEDISDYDEDELYELIMTIGEELREVLMDEFGDMFFGSAPTPDVAVPDAPYGW